MGVSNFWYLLTTHTMLVYVVPYTHTDVFRLMATLVSCPLHSIAQVSR